MAGPILICYDGSRGARGAIGRAGQMLGGGTATVLHVWEPIGPLRPQNPLDAYLSAIGTSPEEYNRIATQLALEIANQGCRLAEEAGFQARPLTERLDETVAKTIVRVGDEQDARVIVLGSRGRSPIKQLFLGSVSNGVANAALRPVLVVPEPDDRDA